VAAQYRPLCESAGYGLGPVGGRRLGFRMCPFLTERLLKEAWCSAVVGSRTTAAKHDMGRLQIVQSDLCRLRTSTQVLVDFTILRAIVWSKLVGTASTVSPPRVEDAGNGHSTSQQSFCRLPCG
jgi:hypothetical protein